LATDPHLPLHRRDAIVRILRQAVVSRQAELVDLLRREGFDATQSSVSRDLRELGVAALGHRKRLLKAIAERRDDEGAADAAAAPSDALPKLSTAPTATAERRHLSVMFCDLVGSTQLATQLDPEDLQQLIANYHQAVAAAVAPYAGHVAQLLGDGVLVYFGYPQAHEDNALRAVRAGLAVLDTIERVGAPDRPALRTGQPMTTTFPASRRLPPSIGRAPAHQHLA